MGDPPRTLPTESNPRSHACRMSTTPASETAPRILSGRVARSSPSRVHRRRATARAPTPPPPRPRGRRLAPGGVAEGAAPPQVETLLRRDGPQMIACRADVEEGARPPPAGISQTPVLDVPRREAVAGERLGHRHHQTEVVLREPEAAMHHDHHR